MRWESRVPCVRDERSTRHAAYGLRRTAFSATVSEVSCRVQPQYAAMRPRSSSPTPPATAAATRTISWLVVSRRAGAGGACSRGSRKGSPVATAGMPEGCCCAPTGVAAICGSGRCRGRPRGGVDAVMSRERGSNENSGTGAPAAASNSCTARTAGHASGGTMRPGAGAAERRGSLATAVRSGGIGVAGARCAERRGDPSATQWPTVGGDACIVHLQLQGGCKPRRRVLRVRCGWHSRRRTGTTPPSPPPTPNWGAGALALRLLLCERGGHAMHGQRLLTAGQALRAADGSAAQLQQCMRPGSRRMRGLPGSPQPDSGTVCGTVNIACICGVDGCVLRCWRYGDRAAGKRFFILAARCVQAV